MKWWAALLLAGVYRHWATNPWQSTSSSEEAPPFSFACKVISGERCQALPAVWAPAGILIEVLIVLREADEPRVGQQDQPRRKIQLAV